MSVRREPCGCRHDGQKWLSMCEACAAEFQERHQRAQIEHQSMGITDDTARMTLPQSSLKAAPTRGEGPVPAVPSSVNA